MAVPEHVNPPCDNGKSLKSDKKLLVISQEIKFARILAGNNPKIRERALKNLKKWFENRVKTVPFTEDDFMRIWKGLFYSMWMSDKPLLQEECAENVASLLHSLPTVEMSLLFFKSGLTILINEWFGIDQLRLDKFLMLVRRLLRQAIVVLRNANFQRSTIKLFSKYLSETILKINVNNVPMGLLMHFIEIYLEELSKIGGDNLNINLLPEFLIPFIQYLAICDDDRLLRHINDHIFIYLIKQSDLGLDYQAKYNVWKQQQFRGTINDIKRIEISSNDDDDDDNVDDSNVEKIYDPRAGRVDVELPQLKFHPKAVAAKLLEYKFVKGSTLKSRKTIMKLVELFKKMATGKYPIGKKQLNSITNDEDYYDTNINNAAKRLMDYDDEIMDRKQQQQQNGDVSDMMMMKNKKRKIDNRKDINNVIVAEKTTKRKSLLLSSPSSSLDNNSKLLLEKRQKIVVDNSILNNENFDKVESIFARNSGIWIVTTNEIPCLFNINKDQKEMEKTVNKANAKSLPHVDDNRGNTMLLRKINKKVNNKHLNKLENKKHLKKLLTRNLLENLDQKLINNLTTPTKKVVINTKLNTSQDVFEHHAQIKSSPAIPYDASKKPIKPLLKTTPINSPINPFYNCL